MNKAGKETSSFHGSFTLPDGKSVFGELLLKGPATTLTLKHASAIGSDFERRNLHGVSVDNDHISCIGCVHSGDRHRMQGRVTTFYKDVFPHYVVVGREHLDPDAAVITCISFTANHEESDRRQAHRDE